MFEEDDRPRPVRARFEPAKLDGWSVADLSAYIAELRTEIGRAEQEIAARGSVRAAADALFRKGGP